MRAGECERRLLRLEDQELAGRLGLLAEKVEQLTDELADTKETLGKQLGEVKGMGVWLVRSFVTLIVGILGTLIVFIVTSGQ